MQDLYEDTLSNDRKSIDQKLYETQQIAARWENNGGPLAAQGRKPVRSDRISSYYVFRKIAYLSERKGLLLAHSFARHHSKSVHFDRLLALHFLPHSQTTHRAATSAFSSRTAAAMRCNR